MKKVKKIFGLVLIIFLSFNCIPAMADTTNSGTMKVSYIDVGQGDSELIQVDGKNILIDAGNNDDKAYNYLKSLGITRLDYVIATHPHSDHIGNMAKIISNFEIGTFYAPKVTTTTKTFENMVDALTIKNIKITVAQVNDTLAIGNSTLTFIAPNSTTYDDLNNYSIVCRLKYGNKSFLFMGDAEAISESEILAKQLDIQSDVLKLGHHGSVSGTTQNFLNTVNPQYAIITVGLNNDYGHPHQETLDKLNAKGIKTYRTDLSGTIVASSNGTDITFITNTPVSEGATNSGINIILNTAPKIDISSNGIVLNNNVTVGASYNGNSIKYTNNSTVSVATDNTTLDSIFYKLKEDATKIKEKTEEELSEKFKEWLN